MSRPAYSSSLFAQAGRGAGLLPIGPVPLGKLWVVRDVDVYGRMGPFDSAQFFLQGGEGQSFVFFTWSSNDQKLQSWRGRTVIAPGENMALDIHGSGLLDVTISGYVLNFP